MDKPPFNSKTATIILIVALILVGVLASRIKTSDFFNFHFSPPANPPSPSPSAPENKLVKFSSKEEFVAYLSEGQNLGSTGFGSVTQFSRGLGAPATAEPFAADGKGGGGGEPVRFSETNVQVSGIDEPDIVKTDGKEIYYASEFYGPIIYSESPVQELAPQEGQSSIYPPIPYQDLRHVKSIKAFPVSELKEEGKISKIGDLLLVRNILVIFSNQDQTIYGYDVTHPEAPTEVWKVELKNSYLIGARLKEGKIYIVVSSSVNYDTPCPFSPLVAKGSPISIPCQEIYHPVANFPADVTYTASILDPAKGEIQSTVSFVGTSYSSAVYMSPQAIYITYPYTSDIFAYIFDFLQTQGSDLLPATLLSRLLKLKGYELSDSSKLNELSLLLQNYYNSIGQDEQRRIQNEFTNRMQDYAKAHLRDLQKTGIIKIGLAKFEVVATGNVPGTLLNQFSLDEYQDNLRLATTLTETFGYFGFGGNPESANDVYILDKDLQTVGSIKDLGLSERVYSTRFIEDRGYVVTFRQVDPFYVLDLSDPKNPKKTGELKIPGYSSYLDAIAKKRVLGVGQEGPQVKLSLFDVSDPANPKEADKYLLNEYWSDVGNNHHAFLADKAKQIFFLPAGQSGYVFSYAGDKISLKRVISDVSAKRAVYINDYLYIIGDSQMVVLLEQDWSEIKRLKF